MVEEDHEEAQALRKRGVQGLLPKRKRLLLEAVPLQPMATTTNRVTALRGKTAGSRFPGNHDYRTAVRHNKRCKRRVLDQIKRCSREAIWPVFT